MNKPLILVSPNRFPAEDRHFYKFKELEYGDASMAESIRIAGGLPLMAYRAGATDPEESYQHALELIAHADALVMTGGSDVSPGTYGQDAMDEAWAGDPVRDAWELTLLRTAEEVGLPILGVCRGHQLLNIHRGGTLFQDIGSQVPNTLEHRSQEQYCGLTHPVILEGPSMLTSAFADEPLIINSVHHQAVHRLGNKLRVTARAPDGTIEAIADTEGRWIKGVQWHPEWMPKSPSSLRIFEALLAEARKT